MEFWNLVFMQYNQAPDGTPHAAAEAVDRHRRRARADAVPAAGRRLGVGDRPDAAAHRPGLQSLTGKSYTPGDYDDRDSFAMRVLAEHARSSTMLVSDGVFPSNEGRGYVLRRIIRRAVRYAYLLGTEKLVMPTLVETAVDVMGNAYPDVVQEPRLHRRRARHARRSASARR